MHALCVMKYVSNLCDVVEKEREKLRETKREKVRVGICTNLHAN